jgi:hypothetical protein
MSKTSVVWADPARIIAVDALTAEGTTPPCQFAALDQLLLFPVPDQVYVWAVARLTTPMATSHPAARVKPHPPYPSHRAMPLVS